MICNQCGAILPDRAHFCATCGSKLDAASSAEPAAYTAPETPPPSFSPPEAPPPAVFEDDSQVSAANNEWQAPRDAHSQPAPPYVKHPALVTAKSTAKAILSVFLSILLFASVVAFIALMIARPERLSGAIADADITTLLDDADLNNIIIDSIDNYKPDNIGIDIDSIRNFLRRENVRDEAAIVVEQYIAAVADGNSDYYISRNDIISFLKAVSPDILDEFGIKLTDVDYGLINDVLSNDILEQYSAGMLLTDANVDFAVPYVLFSIYPLIISGILCAIFAIDIFLLHRKRIRAAFMYAGVPLVIGGLIYVIAGLLSGPFNGILGDNFYTIAQLAAGLVTMALFYGLICLVLGVVLIMIHFIIRKAMQKNALIIPGENLSKAWRYIGLAINLAALAACCILVFLCLRGLPESSEYYRFALGSASKTSDNSEVLDDSSSAFKSGMDLFDKGDYANAIKELKTVISDDTNFDKAQEKIGQAIESYKSDCMAKANELLQDGQLDAALSIVNEGLNILPGDKMLADSVKSIRSIIAASTSPTSSAAPSVSSSPPPLASSAPPDVSSAPQPPESSAPPDVSSVPPSELVEMSARRTNLLDTMTSSDWKALNVFFSNFSEVSFGGVTFLDFDINSINDRDLIEFAVRHNVINYPNRFSGEASFDEAHFSIAEQFINSTIKEYFDIDSIIAQNGRNGGCITYSQGKYYWNDVFEGDVWFSGSQVVEFYKNGDGTYTAVTEDYGLNYSSFDDANYFTSYRNSTNPFYLPKREWGNLADSWSLVGYHVASVAPYIYNGKQTYKLLQYHEYDISSRNDG